MITATVPQDLHRFRTVFTFYDAAVRAGDPISQVFRQNFVFGIAIAYVHLRVVV